MDPVTQHEVVFDDPDGRSLPDPPDDGRAALLAWRADTLEDERRAADRPDDPRAAYSGYWWSTPALSALRCSTRSLESIGPVGLRLVEDAFSWSSARCWSLQLRPAASIFEIGGADDWTELVRRYPLAITKSRRRDWWRATGCDLEWAIPDFHAVAADYDAVHLSVAGYLSTAGRAIRADDTHTVLAGWNPDETWWLINSLFVTRSRRAALQPQAHAFAVLGRCQQLRIRHPRRPKAGAAPEILSALALATGRSARRGRAGAGLPPLLTARSGCVASGGDMRTP
jgi:hypothetical protein